MDMGILGLGVMGRSLALNFERRGFSVAGYDANPKLDTSPFDGKRISVFAAPSGLAAALEPPRRILMMVPAGNPVDEAISALLPHLGRGDILIDGGNSFIGKTERRVRDLQAQGIHFVGMGVSGGQTGALWGPSLMPGGAPEAWDALAPSLQTIAARAEDGAPCVAWMGRDGAGHFVKMVHNGIEYADMQLIAEIYDLLHRGAGISNEELAGIFAEWNEGDLRSYLVEITADILSRRDEESGQLLVELTLDEAAHKGTGKWTSQTALDLGAPIPTISAAVEGRLLSALKAQRVTLAKSLGGQNGSYPGGKSQLIAAARQALYASKVAAHAQGFGLLRAGSAEYGFGLDHREIARVWRAGCIIRAALLNDIASAFERDADLANLLLDKSLGAALIERQAAWREVAQTAVSLGIPAPALSASLAYFDASRSERLPANLTQLQRDYFGAHTYRRVDKDGVFHTRWE